MSKFILLIVFSFSLLSVSGQSFSGRVLAADSKKPLALASVFFSNTSVGMVTNENGEFSFQHLPAGTFDLVISFVGYATQVLSINTATKSAPLEIVMSPKSRELEQVVVEPNVKEKWNKWGDFFLGQFVGNSAEAGKCKIWNARVIQFRRFVNSRRLTAYADEPLLIENKALGYRIKYQLENFEFNFRTNILYYTGYPLFEEMEGNTAEKRRWEKKRQECYLGSLMHFMRSLYRKQTSKNGYAIRNIYLYPNYEKQRVKSIAVQTGRANNSKGKQIVQTADSLVYVFNCDPDSLEYYRQVLHQPDSLDWVPQSEITADNIAFKMDASSVGLYFKNRLLVSYMRAMEPYEFTQSERRRKQMDRQDSQLKMLSTEPIVVLSNGRYADPSSLLLRGYWAFWEKMATMLPYDYEPPAEIEE